MPCACARTYRRCQLSAIQALRQAFHQWLRSKEQPPPDPPPTLHHTTSTRHNPSILRRSRRIQQSANPPPRVVPNTRQAEVFNPTPAPRVDMGAVDAEEPIVMRMRSRRQAMPVPPSDQEKPIYRWKQSRIQLQSNIVTPAMAAARRYPATFSISCSACP